MISHSTASLSKCFNVFNSFRLEILAASEVEHLHAQGLMDRPLWYDPYQLHQVAMNLRKKGILCEEFNQGNERVLADLFSINSTGMATLTTMTTANWLRTSRRQK